MRQARGCLCASGGSWGGLGGSDEQAGRQAGSAAPRAVPAAALRVQREQCKKNAARRTQRNGAAAAAIIKIHTKPNQTKPNQNNNSYGAGADREGDAKVDRALEEEDKRRMAEATWTFDGQVRGGVGRAAATAAAVCFWVRG